jgi:hypothetical protein
MGNWIKLKATAMEIDGHLEMLAVTKSISLLLDLLNLIVEPYTDSVADPVSKIVKNLPQIFVKHLTIKMSYEPSRKLLLSGLRLTQFRNPPPQSRQFFDKLIFCYLPLIHFLSPCAGSISKEQVE